MKQWLISFALFMAVFLGCVATILSPIKVTTDVKVAEKLPGGVEVQIPNSNLKYTYTDLQAMGQNWVDNPNYFITLGITATFAIAGAFWCIHNMAKREDEEKTA